MSTKKLGLVRLEKARLVPGVGRTALLVRGPYGGRWFPSQQRTLHHLSSLSSLQGAGCSIARFAGTVCPNISARITIRCIDSTNGRLIFGSRVSRPHLILDHS